MRRLAAASLLATVVLAALVLGGCGVRPSEVITGRPAPGGSVEGIPLYLLADGQLTLVLRTAKQVDPLTLLALGPTVEESGRGLTSEVPPEIAPIERSTDPGGGRVAVKTGFDVTALSTTAVDQIVCTASPGRLPVSFVGPGDRLGPLVCPLPF